MNMTVNQSLSKGHCKVITTLDYSSVKMINSRELIRDINTHLSAFDYDLAIINFSERFSNAQKLSERIFNSRSLELIVVGEPAMTVALTPHCWRILGELDETIGLPAALEKLQNDAITLRRFGVVTLSQERVS